MKPSFHAVVASIPLLLLGLAIPLVAQNRVAIIATGTLNASYSSPAEGAFDTFFGDLELRPTINPGVEVLVKPDGRISFGAAFTRMRFKREPPLTFVDVRDRFQYIDSSGNPVTVEMPGTIFVSHTTRGEGHMNMLTGLAYVNLVTTGKVRPFVGVGAGIGLAKRDTFQTFIHPLYAQLATDSEGYPLVNPSPGLLEEENSLAVFAGKFGVNIYPAGRLLIRASAGYLNGGYAEVGVGVVFSRDSAR